MDNQKSDWDILAELCQQMVKEHEQKTGKKFTQEDSRRILKEVREGLKST